MDGRKAELPGGTKLRVRGLIRVIEGRFLYRILEASSESVLDPENPGVVRPAQLHEVAPLGRVRLPRRP
jgi:hypothetical protein